MAAKLQKKNGAYWAVVHLSGKRKWKKIGTDKREAQKVVNKINAKIALGEFSIGPEPSQTTVETALREWFNDYRPTFSASFAQIAKINIDRHLVPFFGAMDIREVEERHLLQFIAEKTINAEKPLRASTLRTILSVLRRVMALAVERGDLTRNPCQRMDRLLTKVNRQQAQQVHHVNAWTRSEVATLLDVARSAEPRFYPLITFLLSTGCRRSEALGLKWEDISFDESRIHVRRALVRGQLGTPKSGRARFVVMSDQLEGVLGDLLEERQQATLKGQWKEPPPFVFCSETGGPLDERNVSRSWDRLRRKAQQEDVRPLRLHDARHTFASLALASGKSIPWVSSQLGHASPEITLRVYAHAMKEEETDLSFLDFGGTKRHPDGTRSVAASKRTKPPRLTTRRGLEMMEHEKPVARSVTASRGTKPFSSPAAPRPIL